jgi:hypothetical protein
MQWIYFDAEGAPKRKHALRRVMPKALGWGYLHTFLIAALIIAAAGSSGTLKACSKDTEISTGSRWMESVRWRGSRAGRFCISPLHLQAGLGTATFSMALIWLTSKEQHHRVNRYFIFCARVAASILLVLVPLFTPGVHPVKFNAINAGIVTFIAICTTMGTIVSSDGHGAGSGIHTAAAKLLKRKPGHH